MKLKRLAALFLALSMIFALAACGGDKTQSGGGDTAGGDGGSSKVQVGMSFHSMQNDVFVFSKEYLTQFGKEADPQVAFEFVVADEDVSKQTADVNDLISKKPNVISICPQDSRAVESSIKAAHGAGLLAGQIAVVALLQVDAHLVRGLHLELVHSLAGVGNHNLIAIAVRHDFSLLFHSVLFDVGWNIRL